MGPKKDLPDYSREAAKVGGFIIEEEFLRFKVRLEINKLPEGVFDLSDTEKLKKTSDFKELLSSVLYKLIDNYIIIAYGKKKGVEIPAEELNAKISDRKKAINPKTFDNLLHSKNIPYSRWKQIVENEIRVQYVLDKELAEGLQVSLNEIKTYYRKNHNDFIIPESIRVRQIVTDSLEKAQEVHNRLVKGENFAKLAVNHSLSPDRAQGGDLGFFSKGNLPKEFDEACFKLKKGEISPVVKSDYGYHIFKLLDRKPPGRKTLLEATPEIYQKLFEEKLKKKYDEWLPKARKEIDVEINNNVIENFFL